MAGFGAVEFAEGHRIARYGLRPFDEIGAHRREHAGDAAGFRIRRQEGGAVAGLAGEQTDHRHLAAMRRVIGFEHQPRRVIAGLDAEALRGVGDGRRLVAQRLHQPQHAIRARRAADQHRTDDALAQFLGEIVEHLVARRLHVAEQLLEQFVVMIRERLQHGEARFLLAVAVLAGEFDHFGSGVLLVDMGALEREVDEAGDDGAVPDRNLAQQQRNARGRLQQLDGFADALVGLVDLVEKQEMRNVGVFEFAQNQLQLRHLLLVRFADNDGGIDRRQHAAHVVNEFDGAGAIDKGVAVAHELGGGEGRLDAHFVMAGFA